MQAICDIRIGQQSCSRVIVRMWREYVYRSNWDLYAVYARLISFRVGYRKRGWDGTDGRAVHADVER